MAAFSFNKEELPRFNSNVFIYSIYYTDVWDVFSENYLKELQEFSG